MNTGPGRPRRPASTASTNCFRGQGSSTRTDSTQTGAAMATPSISWMPRWRIAGPRQVGRLHLPAEHEQLAALQEGPGHRGDDVGEPGAGGDEHEGATVAARLVEVLRRDSRGDLVHGGDARHRLSSAVEQVHDVAARDEEAVRVAQLAQPLHHEVGVLHRRAVGFVVMPVRDPGPTIVSRSEVVRRVRVVEVVDRHRVTRRDRPGELLARDQLATRQLTLEERDREEEVAVGDAVSGGKVALRVDAAHQPVEVVDLALGGDAPRRARACRTSPWPS